VYRIGALDVVEVRFLKTGKLLLIRDRRATRPILNGDGHREFLRKAPFQTFGLN
jgi:hypothetical protein